MRFDLDDEALDFLRARGHGALTLRLTEIFPNCCVGRLPDVRLEPGPPKCPEAYRHFHVRGIDIHVDKALKTEKELKLYVSGLGPFKKLEISGLQLIL